MAKLKTAPTGANGRAARTIAAAAPKTNGQPAPKIVAPAAKNVITLTRLVASEVQVVIKGVTPIIPHRWSEKAKRSMPGHVLNQGPKQKKGAREPAIEAEAATYRLGDGSLGMPAVAFKAAMVAACRFFDAPSMVEARLIFWVKGEGAEYGDQLVRIQGTPVLREDVARNSNGSSDLRYRNMITEWSATLTIGFLESSITRESIVALVDAGGRCGVGDWRPDSKKSHTGTFGCWRAAIEGEK
jgi:hypothetical protein